MISIARLITHIMGTIREEMDIYLYLKDGNKKTYQKCEN
jgi:hypothetical protein